MSRPTEQGSRNVVSMEWSVSGGLDRHLGLRSRPGVLLGHRRPPGRVRVRWREASASGCLSLGDSSDRSEGGLGTCGGSQASGRDFLEMPCSAVAPVSVPSSSFESREITSFESRAIAPLESPARSRPPPACPCLGRPRALCALGAQPWPPANSQGTQGSCPSLPPADTQAGEGSQSN